MPYAFDIIQNHKRLLEKQKNITRTNGMDIIWAAM